MRSKAHNWVKFHCSIIFSCSVKALANWKEVQRTALESKAFLGQAEFGITW